MSDDSDVRDEGGRDQQPGRATTQPTTQPTQPTHATRRGVIALLEENCTVCMICARECPDWCIEIESHKETVVPAGGGRERIVAVLDRFAIDYGLCMYCGICVEACPFDALFWGTDDSYPSDTADDLVHERPRLASWLGSVPLTDLPTGETDLDTGTEAQP
ncbi:MAG: 4Fe-4S binding protein [Actinomycetes bacterium]